MNEVWNEEEENDEKIRRRVFGNIKATLLSNVFYLAVRLAIPPVVLAYVSLAEYGLWSYCFVLISYLGMGAFGVTNVYVRYVAIYFEKKNFDAINQVLSTGIIAISGVCFVLFTILWWILPWLLDEFQISSDLREVAFILILGSMLIFMTDLTIGAFNYVLQSLQLIVAEKIIWMVSFTVESLCILALLYYGFGVYSLLWAFAVRSAISIIFSFYIAKKNLPSLSIRWHFFNKESMKLFFHFGGIVQLSGLLGTLNRSIEKVLAGSFINLTATGLYEIGEKFPVMSLNLPGSVTAVLLPAAAQFHATEQEEKIIQVYVRGSRFINLLTGSMMGFMAAFSTPLIDAWLGFNPTYHFAEKILTWFTIAYQMDTLTGPISAIYRAINLPQRELYYGILRLVATLIAAFTAFWIYGASILTINASVVSMMVLSAGVYLFFSNQFLGVNHLRYIRSVILPGLYPYLIGFGLWWLTADLFINLNRVETFFLFLICLFAYLAIWLPLLYWGVYSSLERKEFNNYLLSKIHQ